MRKFTRNLQILDTFSVSAGFVRQPEVVGYCCAPYCLLQLLQSHNKGEISPWGHTKPTFKEIERKLSIEIAMQEED